MIFPELSHDFSHIFLWFQVVFFRISHDIHDSHPSHRCFKIVSYDYHLVLWIYHVFSYDVPFVSMMFPCVFPSLPSISHHFLTILWFFPCVFLWLSYHFLWFSYDFPRLSKRTFQPLTALLGAHVGQSRGRVDGRGSRHRHGVLGSSGHPWPTIF